MDAESNWISGFWRRIGALLIDTLILGLFGLLLGVFFEQWFVELGTWGGLIGFSISLSYFAVLNSRIGSGQTLGKRALKIRVVNGDNRTITIGRSVVRYMVLGTPFFLNGLSLSSLGVSAPLMYLSFIVFFCGSFSIGYLYVFNRRTRQSLHDLVVGSYVVNIDSEQAALPAVWKTHYGVIGTLFVAVSILPLLTTEMAVPSADLLRSQKVLSDHPSIGRVVINSKTYFQLVGGDGSTNQVIDLQVSLTDNRVKDHEFAETLARSLIASYPRAIEKDSIDVVLVYGYDIGIATKWASHLHRFVPNELLSNKTVEDLLQTTGLKVGMTRDMVTGNMGRPIDRGLNGEVDEWHYCSNNDAGNDDYLVLYFVQDTLVAAGNYYVAKGEPGSAQSDCSLFVKQGSYRPPDYTAVTRLAGQYTSLSDDD